MASGSEMTKTKTIDHTKGIYRRVYASFLTGRRINAVSMEAEAWFWRLQALADDFGAFPADPRVLPSQAAPRRKIGVAKSERWVGELVEAGLIRLYTVDDIRFGEIEGFDVYQKAPPNGRRIRKYPPRVNPGESGGVLMNPGETCIPHAQSQSQAQINPPYPPQSGGNVEQIFPAGGGNPKHRRSPRADRRAAKLAAASEAAERVRAEEAKKAEKESVWRG